MSLVKEVNPDARRKGTVFDFAIVFPDARRGGFIMKEIGSTAAGRKGTDDAITLESKKFQIGDFIDVAIQSPRIGRRDRPYWYSFFFLFIFFFLLILTSNFLSLPLWMGKERIS